MYKRNRLLSIKKQSHRNKGLITEIYSVAPSPSRDYHALELYQQKFFWTRWKICHGPNDSPQQKLITMDEYLKDVNLQNELSYIFGEDTRKLIHDLAHQNWSLISMPSNIIQKICSYLTVSDILRLSQVCKRLAKECSHNELWRNMSKKQWKILLQSDIEKAGLIGWKRVYLEKMKPRRYKGNSKPVPRQRVSSSSTLKNAESKISTKSTFTIASKPNTSRTTSDLFSNFSTKLTDRNMIKSRNSETRCQMTPRSKIHQTSYSVTSLRGPKESDTSIKNKLPHPRCKVTSVRTRSATQQTTQPTDSLLRKVNKEIVRPNSSKIVIK